MSEEVIFEEGRFSICHLTFDISHLLSGSGSFLKDAVKMLP